MRSRLNIPEKLKVGFNKRSDTYSGLLAYVVYYKGKNIAKETSWEGWRDKSIDPMDLDNVPTEGFVLNRHAGGCKSGWDFRQSYCRVWDPRGFEFEITIPNLLFILDHCTSEKGRGLSGEFVYAWDGKDLVLLPCDSPDYQESKKNIDKKEKICARNMVVGSLYETMNGEQLIYLGAEKMVHEWYKGTYYKHKEYFYNEKKYYIFSIVSYNNDSYKEIVKGKPNIALIGDLKKIRYKVSDNEMSAADCEDMKQLCVNHMWFDNPEHKLGNLNFSFKEPEFVEWKEIMDNPDNINKDYFGYYVVSDDLIYKFRFVKTNQNNFIFKDYCFEIFKNYKEKNRFSRNTKECYGNTWYTTHTISKKDIFDNNLSNKELIDTCTVYCVPISQGTYYDKHLTVSNEYGLTFKLGQFENRINSKKLVIKYL